MDCLPDCPATGWWISGSSIRWPAARWRSSSTTPTGAWSRGPSPGGHSKRPTSAAATSPRRRCSATPPTPRFAGFPRNGDQPLTNFLKRGFMVLPYQHPVERLYAGRGHADERPAHQPGLPRHRLRHPRPAQDQGPHPEIHPAPGLRRVDLSVDSRDRQELQPPQARHPYVRRAGPAGRRSSRARCAGPPRPVRPGLCLQAPPARRRAGPTARSGPTGSGPCC